MIALIQKIVTYFRKRPVRLSPKLKEAQQHELEAKAFYPRNVEERYYIN